MLGSAYRSFLVCLTCRSSTVPISKASGSFVSSSSASSIWLRCSPTPITVAGPTQPSQRWSCRRTIDVTGPNAAQPRQPGRERRVDGYDPALAEG